MKELLIMAKSLGGGGSEVALIDYYNNRRYQHRLFIQTPMQAHVSAMNRAA